MKKHKTERMDQLFHFRTTFDPSTGYYERGNVLLNGVDTGRDPFMAEFPHLLDIGIMGHCIHGLIGMCELVGTGCYQSGHEKNEPNMSLDDYKIILDQCVGKLDQVALGGRGDPDCHEEFFQILEYTTDLGIVPNFTTSGYLMTKEKALKIAPYVGAVAVSWYGTNYTLEAINHLIAAGVKTNIHYVLNDDTIQEAYRMLTTDSFPEGINRVIFLLHKPIGLGKRKAPLDVRSYEVHKFYQLFDHSYYANKVGFDSCTVPGLLEFTKNLDKRTMEPCEAARFSGYIDANLNFSPCSFDREGRWYVDLHKHSIQDAWFSEPFSSFRDSMRMSCSGCVDYASCLGGCPIVPSIILCSKKVNV